MPYFATLKTCAILHSKVRWQGEEDITTKKDKSDSEHPREKETLEIFHLHEEGGTKRAKKETRQEKKKKENNFSEGARGEKRCHVESQFEMVLSSGPRDQRPWEKGDHDNG